VSQYSEETYRQIEFSVREILMNLDEDFVDKAKNAAFSSRPPGFAARKVNLLVVD
jgi:hypothetical protein